MRRGVVGRKVDVGLKRGEGGAQAVFDFGGDVVGVGEGERWVELDMKVDDAQSAVASGAEVMEVSDPGGGGDDGADAVEFVGREGGLKQLGNYRLTYLIGHDYDEDTDEYGSDGIEDTPLLAKKHGSGNTEQCGDGG